MMKVIGIVVAAIILAIAGPLLTLWSLNTLFPSLNIPYTIWTYLAAAVIVFQVAYRPSK
jgi:hypothetical protein